MGERRGSALFGRRRLPASGQRRLGVRRERRDDPAVILPPREHFLGHARADGGAALDVARRRRAELTRERRVVGRRRRRG